LSVATSVAAAIGAAGAGGTATVNVNPTLEAYAGSGATLKASTAITITATATNSGTAITYGTAAGAVAVGTSTSSVTTSGSVKAHVDGVISGSQTVTVKASAMDTADAEATGLAGGIISGAGAGATATVAPTIQAYTLASITATTSLSITAALTPETIAKAIGVAVSYLVGVGASNAQAINDATIDAYVGIGSQLTGGTLSVSAQQLLPSGTTPSAYAFAAAGGGGTLLGANATVANASTSGSVEAYTGGAVKLPDGDVSISANNNTAQSAVAIGVSVGYIALGADTCTAGSSVTTAATLGVGASTDVGRTGAISVLANGADQNTSAATAGAGGVYAGNAATGLTNDTSTVSAEITSGTLYAGNVTVNASNNALYAPSSNSLNASAYGASGSTAKNDDTTSATATIGNNLITTITATGKVIFEALNGFQETTSGDSAQGAGGGVVNGAAVLSFSTLNGTASLNVGDNVTISSGTDPVNNPGGIAMVAASTISAIDQVTLTSGGALAGGFVNSELDGTLHNTVTIGTGDTFTSKGNIGAGTYTTVNAQMNAYVSTFGLAVLGSADATSNVTSTQAVNVGASTSMSAFGNVNLTAGNDPTGLFNTSMNGQTSAQGYVRGLIAIPLAQATSTMTSLTSLSIASGDQINSGQNVTIGAFPGVPTSTANGTGHGFELGFIPATTDGSTPSSTTSSTVTQNGTITAGIYHELNITIPIDPSSFFSKTITTNPDGSPFASYTSSFDPSFSAPDFVAAHYSGTDAQLLNTGISSTPVGAFTLGTLYASGGVVTVNANTITGTGSITAYGGPTITVTNNSPDYLILGAIDIPDLPSGQVNFTGAASQAAATKAGITIAEVGANVNGGVTINQNYNGTVGNPSNNDGPALLLTGPILNLGGFVHITNVSGSLGQGATIDGQQVNVSVPKGVVVVQIAAPGVYYAGSNPYSQWNSYMIWPGGNPSSGAPSANTAVAYVANLYIANIIAEAAQQGVVIPFPTTATDLTELLIGQAGDTVTSSGGPGSEVFYGDDVPWVGYQHDGSAATAAGQSPIGQAYSISGSAGGNEGSFPMVPVEALTKTASSFASADLTGSQKSSAIYGGQVSINAQTIDINGGITAGQPTNWSLNLSTGLATVLQIYKLFYDLGFYTNPDFDIPLNTVATGDAQITATYNAQTNQITVDNVSASSGGGFVNLHGAIISTDTLGDIHVNGGLGQVTVNNQTGIPLVIQNIYTGNNASAAASFSKVDITDTNQSDASKQQTLYVYQPGQPIQMYTGADGATLGTGTASSTINGTSATYSPQTGMRWQWVESASLSRTVSLGPTSTVTNWTWNFPNGQPNNPWQYIDPSTSQPYIDPASGLNVPIGQLVNAPGGPVFQETITGSSSDGDAVLVYYHNGHYGFAYGGQHESDGRSIDPWFYSYATNGYLTLTMSVQADNPIGIDFSGSTTGSVSITSNAPVYLDGKITNPNGTTTISAQGSIVATADTSIVSDTLTLTANGGGVGTPAAPIHVVMTPAVQLWNTAKGGTFTISTTLDGHTVTTGAIDRHADAATIQSKLNSLTFTDPTNGTKFTVNAVVTGQGTASDPWLISGLASFTTDDTNLTGGSSFQSASTVGNLDVTAGNQGVYLDVSSALTIDKIAAGSAASGYGNVVITAAANIAPNLAASTGTVNVTGDNITITSNAGAVGSEAFPLDIAANGLDDTGRAGGVVTVNALDDIGLVRDNGDLLIGAIVSTGGSVFVTASNGSIYDARGTTSAQALSEAQIQQVWSSLQLTASDGAAENANATVTAFENQVDINYLQYWQLISNGTVSNGTLTLNATGLDIFRPRTAAALQIPFPTDDQIQTYANSVYQDTVKFFDINFNQLYFQLLENGNVQNGVFTLNASAASTFRAMAATALGITSPTDAQVEGWAASEYQTILADQNPDRSWMNLPDFKTFNPHFNYVATTDQVTALTQNSVWTEAELRYAVDSTGLGTSTSVAVGSADPNISGRTVVLSSGDSMGRLASAIDVTLADMQAGTLTDIQKAALVLATAPGDITLLGVDANGATVTFALGNQPSGVTLTGLRIKQTAPLFVAASLSINVNAGGSAFLQSTAQDLTIDQIKTGGFASLTAPGNIQSAGTSSPIIIGTGGDLTLVAGTGNIGTSPSSPLAIQVGGVLDVASAGQDVYLKQVGLDLNFDRIVAGGGVVNLAVPSGGLYQQITNIPVIAQTFSFDVRDGVNGVGAPLEIQLSYPGTINGQAGGDINISSITGSLTVQKLYSTAGNVTLASAHSILDGIDRTQGDASPDISGQNINLTTGGTDGAIGSATDFLVIHLSASPVGKLSGTTNTNAYILQDTGDLTLGQLSALFGEVDLTAPHGSILSGSSGINLTTVRTYLIADQNVGISAAPLLTSVAYIEGSAQNGTYDISNTGPAVVGGVTDNSIAVYAGAGASIQTHSPLEISKDIIALTGDINQTGNRSAGGGNDLIVDAGVTINAEAGNVFLGGGDNVTITAGSMILAPAGKVTIQSAFRLGLSITGGDGEGTMFGTPTVFGHTITGSMFPTLAITPTTDTLNLSVNGVAFSVKVADITYATAADLATAIQTAITTGLAALTNLTAPTFSVTALAAGADSGFLSLISVGSDPEPNVGTTITLDGTISAAQAEADGSPYNDTITVNSVHATVNTILAPLTLDGQDGSDKYIINYAGAGSSLITVHDSGSTHTGDLLTLNGTPGNDQFLLRANFVALLHNLQVDGTFQLAERVNYDTTMGGLVVNGLGGNDAFTMDDNSAPTTLNGGAGSDSFQIGQLFGTDRVPPTNVAAGDQITTIHTTRGYVSVGATYAVTANGGGAPVNGVPLTTTDTFIMYHNDATVSLNGGGGDNLFVVQAFALFGSHNPDPSQQQTNVNGGNGANTIEYALDAPVNIKGGPGLNTLVVLGTELNDTFAITSTGITGAGVNVNYTAGNGVGDIQVIEVDTEGGNDSLYIGDVAAGSVVKAFGGPGSDTFYVAQLPVGFAGVDPSNLAQGDLARIQGSLVLGGGDDSELPALNVVTILYPGEVDQTIAGQTGTQVVSPTDVDTVNVDNTASPRSNETGTLTATNLSGLGMGVGETIRNHTYLPGITYSDLTNLNINLGSHGNRILITGTAVPTTTVLNTGTGVDTVNVQATGGPTTVNTGGGSNVNTVNVTSTAPTAGGIVDNIQGAVTVVGNGFDTMNVDDTGSTTAKVGTLTPTMLTGLNMGSGGVTYAGLANLNINLGSGGNNVVIAGTAVPTTTYLNSGTGVDTVSVQATGGPTKVDTGGAPNVTPNVNVVNVGSLEPTAGGIVDNIKGALKVVGTGADTMTVDDTGSNTAKAGTLKSTTLTGLDMGFYGITYSGLSNLTISLGTGGTTGNVFIVAVASSQNLPATTTINGGSAAKDGLVASWGTDFNGTLNLFGFATSMVTVGNNFNGSMTDTNPGSISTITIGGSLTASGVLQVASTSDPVNPTAPTGLLGNIGMMTVAGSIAGLVQVSGNITTLNVGPANTPTANDNVSGQVIVGGALTTASVSGNVSGTIQERLTVNSFYIGGSVKSSGVIKAVNGADPANPTSSTGLLGDINTMTVNGSIEIAGLVKVSGNVTTLNVGPTNTPTTNDNNDVSGQVIVGGALTMANVSGNVSGTIQEGLTVDSLYIGGSVTPSGMISAGNTGNTVNPALANIHTMTIQVDLAGQLNVLGTLMTLTVHGGTPGTVTAGQIGTIGVYAGYGPVVAQIEENGIQRRIEASVPSAPFPTAPTPAGSPLDITFQYFYEGLVSPTVEGLSPSTNLANPQLTARVANTSGNIGVDQFDFSLITYNDAAKFNLARLDATGNSGISGIRNVAVEGDILTSVTFAASSFFGPGSSPAGVYLPMDQLAGVAVRDFVPDASISAKSIQAVAFGSHDEKAAAPPSNLALELLGQGTVAEGGDQIVTGAASQSDEAAELLVKGTKMVQANDTFRVPFADLTTQQVQMFFVTDPRGGHFDNHGVVLAVQSVTSPNSAETDNVVTPSNVARGAVIAMITVAGTFDKHNHLHSSIIETIALRGDGGSIQTKQTIGILTNNRHTTAPFTPSITSTGPLGDIIIQGDLPSVTAPSIFGSLLPGGGIPATSIIQTTGIRTDPITGATSQVSADLGRVYVTTTRSGPIVTTTQVQLNHSGLAGQILCGGNLISSITTAGPLTGRIVSIGNIDGNVSTGAVKGGVIATNGTINGNLTINGPFSGQLLSVGNINGNVTIHGGLGGGRIAALGSILGNLTINGAIGRRSALVSGGSIGNTTTGTGLSVGTVNGILGSGGPIHNNKVGRTRQALYYNQKYAPDTAVIDAIFSQGLKSPFSPTDLFDHARLLGLENLSVILANLSSLTVTKGKHLQIGS